MLTNEWIIATDLIYRAHVCGCAACKRAASRAAENLRASVSFTRACEAVSDAAVVQPQPLRRQLTFAQRTMFLELSSFCAAIGASSSN
jgi:hypothetical protein